MNIHNINTIARYEVKLLKRSWLFRIFAVLALVGITGALLINQTNIFNRFDIIWPKIAVSSLMPFNSVYFYNIAQSIIVIFLAGSFLKRDKKLDTAEVIYVRPMSNADYIIGKTWGIIKVFVSLNIISLTITAFLNILITRSPFDIFPYIFYLLTISVPSLLFVLGLSFTAMCLLKNQAVTFIVMLGIIGTVFFYLTDSLYGVFDFFGVNIPAIFSDVTGHADIRLFLLQRLIYLLAGIGLICFTIALVKRLPHKPWKIIIVNMLGGILLLAACSAGFAYVFHYQYQIKLRNEYITSFNKYAEGNKANILIHDITVTPNGKHLEGKSIIKVTNSHPEALEQIIFYLNPALEVTSIETSGSTIPFRRENQVVIVDKALANGEELTLTINYNGGISENICYTDVPEESYLNTEIPDQLYRFGKRYAWLDDKYTLLTPEAIWYPVTIPPVNPGAPYNVRKNFTDFTLTVYSKDNKTILSQGESKKEEGKTVFTNRFPLPGISLTIAGYEKKSLQVDSVNYEIYYFKGHDYFSEYFQKLNDTLPGLVRNLKNDIEVSNRRDYLFKKFVLAETPVQFASYIRNWKGHTDYIMPEIVLIPERGVTLNSDFRADKARIREWRNHSEGAPDETEADINNFQRFIQSTFISESVSKGWSPDNKTVNQYNITPMLFGFTGFVQSNDYPVIDIAINSMQQVASGGGFSFWGGIINDSQRANLYLESNSFQAALRDMKIKPEIFYEMLKLKSLALKNYIIAHATEKDFNDFLRDFFNRNRFKDIPLDSFIKAINENFGIDITDFIHTWYTVDHSPTLYIKDVDANQVVMDEFTKYQVKFKINNPSDVDAIITTQTMQGGGFGGGRRGGGMAMSISVTSDGAQNYIIPAGQAREIKIINDERPANLSINTNISHNLPTSHTFNFSKIDNVTSDTSSGIFPIDPTIFKPNPNEIIIDNEDRGFKTIASNNRHKLKDLFKKEEEEKYKNFMPWSMPSQWTVMAADYCYGETINSAVYKSKGSGANAVEWKAEIPKDGYYEISIWNPKMSFGFGMGGGRRGRRERREERNQTYIIQYDKEKESITLDLEAEDGGWLSVGNFYLPKGEVTVSLTDKVSGNYVIADAVKFTKVDE